MKYPISFATLSIILGLTLFGCGGGSETPPNKKPVADAGNDIDINVNNFAQFDASSSKDVDGTIKSYEWKEGAIVLSTAKSFEKNDFSIGTHNIKLSVTDNEGATATDDLVLIVRETKLVFLKDDKHGTEPWMTNGTASGTYLVKDINQQQQSSAPENFVWVGDTLFFSASDDAHGKELWISDGTTAGTRLLKDITPGTKGSYPRRLKKVGNNLFFAAKGGLWKSDGTEAGTVLLRDFKAGGFSRLRQINGVVYFAARDKTYGTELWRSDGTVSGTKMVKDINKGSGSSISIIDMSSFVMKENIYFNVRIANDFQFWKSDGTEEGTVMLKNIVLQRKSFVEPIIINNFHYFVAKDDVHGFEMWKTDGTEAGTQMVKDINIGERGSLENNSNHYPTFSVVDNTLIFQAYDRVNGHKMWKTDGTEAGTQILKDLFSGYSGRSTSGGTVTHKNEVYFYFNDYTILSGPRNLWKTDGTEAGTKLIKGGLGYGSRLHSAGDYVYFINHGKLWRTDGTENGTLIVKNDLIIRDFNYDLLNPIIKIADHNGIIYFSASDGEHGYELWKSDGTDAGTVMVKDINTATHDSVGEYTHVYKKGLHYYFAARTELGHTGLWKTDGSEIGTILIKDFNEGRNSYNPSKLVQAGKNFYFNVNDEATGYELWKSDGTKAGTKLLKDINKGVGGSHPNQLISKGGKTYFTTGDYGSQSLWITDGTEVGTVSILTDTSIYSRISSGSYGGSTPFTTQLDMVIINDIFYFSQNNRNTGGRGKAELWKSDGTSEGTKLIKKMSIDDNIRNMVELNNALYFTISDQLWKSDGFKAGTVQVKDIDGKEEAYLGSIEPLIVLDNKVYFGADDRLWVSDGSRTGTKMIADIHIGSQPIFTGLVTSGNLLYFSGKGLWRSDGTENGTLKLKDSFEYIHSSFENGALFTADDGEGTALWRTNGTEAGTEEIKALY